MYSTLEFMLILIYWITFVLTLSKASEYIHPSHPFITICKQSYLTDQLSLLELISALPVLNLDLDPPLFNLLPVNLNTSLHDLAGLDLPDTLRCARQDQVTRLEGHHTGNVCQDARDAEQHQPRRVRLAQLVADRQLQEGIMRVRDPGLGDTLRDGQEGVEALSDRPGQTLALGLVLDVARRHVDCEDVTFSPSPVRTRPNTSSQSHMR